MTETAHKENRENRKAAPLKHIAFIPDGNRRWAKLKGKTLWEAYGVGMRKIKDVLEWCKELGIKEATFWGFSMENFKRGEEEKKTIWELFEKVLMRIMNEYRKAEGEEKGKVKVRFLGRLHFLPEKIKAKMEELMEATRENGPYIVNILVAYGGRAEITDAINRLLKEGIKTADEGVVSEALYLKDDVDLIIRTGRETRTSGYLPWQSPYAEWYFSKKLWPDFDKAEFHAAIEDFKSRERRFGT